MLLPSLLPLPKHSSQKAIYPLSFLSLSFQVHGPCRNINTAFRPVPLSWFYLQEMQFKTQLLPLLAPGNKALSKEIEAFRLKGDKVRGGRAVPLSYLLPS